MPSPSNFDPQYPSEPSSSSTIGSKLNDIEPKKMKILVVDDDSLTRKLMSRMLTRLGCTVETAENGQAALDLLLGTKTPVSQTPTPSSIDPPTITPTPNDQPPPTPLPTYFDVVFLDNQMVS
jgi:CheY-like chemotaxis protein